MNKNSVAGHRELEGGSKIERMSQEFTFFLFFRMLRDLGPQVLVMQRFYKDQPVFSLPFHHTNCVQAVIDQSFGKLTGDSLLRQFTERSVVSVLERYNEVCFGPLKTVTQRGKSCGYSIGLANTDPPFTDWVARYGSAVNPTMRWIPLAELKGGTLDTRQEQQVREMVEIFEVTLEELLPRFK